MLAYVISAYKNLGQVVRLIERLCVEPRTVLVHVDKKTDVREYERFTEALTGLPTVQLLERHTCNWGGFGHVRATLKGINALLDTDAEFSHVALLTGQDYPIKPLSAVERFFDDHAESSFMSYNPLPSEWWSPRGGLDRIEYRHWRTRRVHMRLPVKRAFPAGLEPFGGGAYWMLSRTCTEYVAEFVADRPDVVRFFRHVDIPDELFFQTIVLNSRHADSVVNDNLRYIDWTRGTRPAVLDAGDLPALRASPKLFARKFDVNHDAAVLDQIDSELLREHRPASL